MIAHWADKLVTLGACEDGVAWARQYASAQAAWDACVRGDWMEWLLDAAGRSLPPEYERILNTALAEYERIRNTALAEYERIRAAALGKYDRACAAALEEYVRICDAARAEHERVCAEALRAYVPVCPLAEEAP